MRIILLTGSSNCGKSYAIYELAQWMLDNDWKDDYDGLDEICKRTSMSFDDVREKQDSSGDICQLFVKSGLRCLLWAPMDDQYCLKSLKGMIEQIRNTGRKVDYLVTTLRRFDDTQHQLTLREMGWSESGVDLLDSDRQEIIQIPVLRVKHELNDPEKIIRWYNTMVAKQLQILFAYLVSSTHGGSDDENGTR